MTLDTQNSVQPAAGSEPVPVSQQLQGWLDGPGEKTLEAKGPSKAA